MPKESVLFGVAGIFLGVLIGWIIGSQQAAAPRMPAAPQAQTAASPQGQAAPPRLDERRVGELRAAAERDPRDAASRIQLGNLYFDSERFPDAVRWYEDALKIDPRNPNVSTDLGIAFYYMNQPDRALAQFERSLTIDPNHSKTLHNIGIVRAFGKQDLEGAAKAWQRVIEIAPDSAEGRAARQALDGLRSAHPEAGAGASSGKTSGSQD